MVTALSAAVAVIVSGVYLVGWSGDRGSPILKPGLPVVAEQTTVTTSPSASASAATTQVAARDIVAAALTAALEPVWADSPDGCISVWRGDQPLYEANADRPVPAASVVKMLTAVAALDVLGPDERLSTTVMAASPPVDGVIVGDLWVVGGGDPVLGTTEWATRSGDPTPLFTPLEVLADRVVDAGVSRVAGRVIGDETRYDAERVVDTWPHRFVDDGEVGPLSALSVNDGFRVWGHPGVPFDDPAAGAADVFADLLRSRGVTIDGPTASGQAAGGVTVAVVQSPPVGDVLAEMLRDSDNGTAELLVKELGVRRSGEGSTAAGVAVVTEILAARGLPTQEAVVADGSGLSEAARLTCRLVTAVLVDAQYELAPRLAVAGESGTLAHRFGGTAAEGRLRAKTGSVDGVAAIAGYLDRSDGEAIQFVYVVNGLGHGASGRSHQDRFVTSLLTP